MIDQNPTPGSTVDLRLITNVAYGLFALGLVTAGFFGIASVAAMVLMYVKRADAAGTVYAAHFDWLSKTFWWGILWFGLSGLATYIYIGWIGVAVTAVWVIYRLIKGWLNLLEKRGPNGI